MRTAVVAATFAGVVAANWGPDSGSWGQSGSWDQYTTEVVTAYTTYCPEATEISHYGQTYTATEATTLTLPCPEGCTVTYSQSSASSSATSVVPTSYPVTTSYSAPPTYIPPPASTAPIPAPPAPYPAPNTTVPYSTPAPVGTTVIPTYGSTGSPIPSAPPATGAASKSCSIAIAAIVGGVGILAAF